jgi:uncharacterized protein (UPF0276 family)
VKFAVNYSPPAVRLSQQGQIRVDLFKCPAWRDLVHEIAGKLPIYVHFPLRAGGGTGHLVDTEKNQFADLDFMEDLRVRSQTPFLNVHLSATAGDCPGLAYDAVDAVACERVASQLLRDLEPAVERWGADRIVLENIYDHGGQYYYAAFVPEVIQRVIKTSGCGLLLDVSHARLGARCLGLEARSYLQSLPLSRLKEIHVTGIQLFDERWMERLRAAGLLTPRLRESAGRLMDHLPMTPPDWEFFEWVAGCLRDRLWPSPELVAFEYGGLGSWWEALTEDSVLLEQIPRFRSLLAVD